MASRYTLEEKIAYANKMRVNPTPAEEVVRGYLRSSHCTDWPEAVSQWVIAGYIVDFYFHEANVVIEVDGNIHLDKEVRKKDALRSQHLKERGIAVFRISNDSVLCSASRALAKVRRRFEREGVLTKRIGRSCGCYSDRSQVLRFRPERPAPLPPPPKTAKKQKHKKDKLKNAPGKPVDRLCRSCMGPYQGRPDSDFCSAECCAEYYEKRATGQAQQIVQTPPEDPFRLSPRTKAAVDKFLSLGKPRPPMSVEFF